MPRSTPPGSALLVLALASALGGCGSKNESTPSKGPAPRDALHVEAPTKPLEAPTREQRAAFAKSTNAFGIDLMKAVGATPGNYVLSPASVSAALTMTFAGARGETEAEMRRVLSLDGPVADVAASAGRTLQALEDLPAPITLRVANRLFGEQTITFEPAFLSLAKDTLGAPLVPVDFIGKPDAARLAINDWASFETDQRINDLLPDDAVTPATRLMLANAIYFLADWASPFKASNTKSEPFTTGDKSRADARMMHQTESARFVARDGFSALSLGYEGGSLSMMLILPDAIDGLPAVEASLDSTKIDAIARDQRSEEVIMAIPRFELSPPTIPLSEVLRKLGMRSAFDGARADFSGMSTSTRLQITDVFHKAFIKVSEKGTEAAASTMVAAGLASASPVVNPPKRFVADHPFLFLIRDDAAGTILFAGRVDDPTHG